jgi:hypothetical protein
VFCGCSLRYEKVQVDPALALCATDAWHKKTMNANNAMGLDEGKVGEMQRQRDGLSGKVWFKTG